MSTFRKQHRVALIGEAGHVIPPIGAQGLNLSLRDGATLAEVTAAAKDRGGDPGDTEVLHIYDRRRRIDVTSRVNTVDILNRSLITSFAPFHALRGVGLIGLSLLPRLRRQNTLAGRGDHVFDGKVFGHSV